MDLITVAESFITILGELLLENGVARRQKKSGGRHRPRKIEITVNKLSEMKKQYQRKFHSHAQSFLQLVHTHNRSLLCLREDASQNTLREEHHFHSNSWAYADEHYFPSSNILETSVNMSAATHYFTDAYSDSNDYQTLPDCILQDLPTSFDTPFDESPIIPSLVHQTLHHCSSQSSPGFDRITYTHL